MVHSNSSVLQGLENPVHDSGLLFRSVLDAISRPGKICPCPITIDVPHGLNMSAHCFALMLCDIDTVLWLAGSCDTAETLWDGVATWAVRRADDLKHWTPPSASGWVICDTLSARVHPRRACAALSAGLAVLGVPVQPDGTERGTVVEATGAAGLQTLSARMGRPVGTAVKGQAALLAFAAPQAPQVFVDGLHLVPHGDGTLAVGSTSERTFEEATTVDAQLDDVLHRARAAMPVLQDAPVLERWAGLRPRAKSRAPILGPHPLDPGRYVANGGFKIGFGMAPKAAEALADLILENRDTIPADFRPETCL